MEERPAPSEPIVLETLQGDWVNSMGAKISVKGTEACRYILYIIWFYRVGKGELEALRVLFKAPGVF